MASAQLASANLRIIEGVRYMDDIRIFLMAIRLGWRWTDGGLRYRSSWKLEEEQAGMTATTKAAQCLEGMMNSICGWLKLTMETEEMFSGRLPTLDLEIWIEEVTNKIMFTFYEKPMVARTVLMKRSAMPENTRMATLNQEMIRRMVNTSEMVGEEERCEIVDKYATKLVNSEYSIATTRKIITGGLKGYERMLSTSRNRKEPGWKPLHMPASFKSKERRTAKMLAKTNWFKSRGKMSRRTQ